MLLLGAAVALVLAWWCDLRRLDPDDFLEPTAPHDGTKAEPALGSVSSGTSAPAGG